MSTNDDIKKNGSGYYDPTAYKAIRRMGSEEKNVSGKERFDKLLNEIFMVCKHHGFHLENRVVLRDIKTGKIWK